MNLSFQMLISVRKHALNGGRPIQLGTSLLKLTSWRYIYIVQNQLELLYTVYVAIGKGICLGPGKSFVEV